MKTHVLRSLILLGLIANFAMAQNDLELDRLDSKVIQHLEAKMAGWQHRRIEPVQGSTGVIINHWQTAARIVTISIIKYDSAKQAMDTMQPFIKYMRQKEELKGLGTDAYAWGYGLSNVVFRRGRFIFHIDTHAAVESDADAQTLSPLEKGVRERSEMRRLSLEFAQHIATAVDQP